MFQFDIHYGEEKLFSKGVLISDNGYRMDVYVSRVPKYITSASGDISEQEGFAWKLSSEKGNVIYDDYKLNDAIKEYVTNKCSDMNWVNYEKG
jgi:hypothetical protein